MRVVMQFDAAGKPTGGSLILATPPVNGIVVSVGHHTYLIVDKQRKLYVANFFDPACLSRKRINAILRYFGEKPIEI